MEGFDVEAKGLAAGTCGDCGGESAVTTTEFGNIGGRVIKAKCRQDDIGIKECGPETLFRHAAVANFHEYWGRVAVSTPSQGSRTGLFRQWKTKTQQQGEEVGERVEQAGFTQAQNHAGKGEQKQEEHGDSGAGEKHAANGRSGEAEWQGNGLGTAESAATSGTEHEAKAAEQHQDGKRNEKPGGRLLTAFHDRARKRVRKKPMKIEYPSFHTM